MTHMPKTKTNAKTSTKPARKDFDSVIFSDSEIMQTATSELVEDLSKGLSSADADFIAEAATELRERLKPKRFAHSISVARTCRRMAKLYDVDLSMAVRAGLIHDWDKCYHGQEVFDRVVEVGLELPQNYKHMEPLFHSITGAKALGEKYPQLEPEILQAISRHTSGCVQMSPLDMLLYVADMLEPTRTYETLEPLRELIGKVPLDELFSQCFRATVEHLVSRGRYLHPDTAEIWNTWVAARLR